MGGPYQQWNLLGLMGDGICPSAVCDCQIRAATGNFYCVPYIFQLIRPPRSFKTTFSRSVSKIVSNFSTKDVFRSRRYIQRPRAFQTELV